MRIELKLHQKDTHRVNLPIIEIAHPCPVIYEDITFDDDNSLLSTKTHPYQLHAAIYMTYLPFLSNQCIF